MMKGIQQTMNAEIIIFQAIKRHHKLLMLTFVSCGIMVSFIVGVTISTIFSYFVTIGLMEEKKGCRAVTTDR